MNEPTPGTVFPSDVDELTPAILGAALAERHPGVVVEHVEVVAAKRCGEGVASTADRLVLDLSYRSGTAARLPRRLILKTMLASPARRHAGRSRRLDARRHGDLHLHAAHHRHPSRLRTHRGPSSTRHEVVGILEAHA